MCHEYLAKVTRRSFSPKPEVERLVRETTPEANHHACTHMDCHTADSLYPPHLHSIHYSCPY